MRPGNNNRRGRGRGPRKPHGGSHNHGGAPSKGHTFDSSGPDIRVRGNAYQVLEKYLQLARDAGTAGDRVAAENFLQHADHYYRVVASMNEGQRPRIGGREISVADVNVQNVSQGLSAALSGHGHSNAGDDLASESPSGNHGNGQARTNPSSQGGDSENRPSADSGEEQPAAANGSDEAPAGNSSDEQPDYPEELLPADAANAAQPQQEGRQPARTGRGRRRGPGRRVRSEGGEEAAAQAPAPTSGEAQ